VVQVLNSCFRKLSAQLASDTIKPLPSNVYGFSEIKTALREFSHARHVGKIVVSVSLPDQLEHGSKSSSGSAERPSEACAITGGLGALGSITAEWLAGHGVKHIHLLGRSGRWSGHPTSAPPFHTSEQNSTPLTCFKNPTMSGVI
jgi:NADPH:quinone reductase-like Zn-dependent oxidoreductase